ncbi:MAG: hypothetical protein QNL04_07425 [SAR324 cluster bacterium]|nr:hypothetical protein [SAR324 cluster bacterium]
MTQPLKEYTYNPAASSFIGSLEGLGIKEIEQKLVREAATNSDSYETILAGFHYLVKTLIALREDEDSDAKSPLEGSLIDSCMGMMKEHNQFFGYESGNDFFQIVDEATPAIFIHNGDILPALVKYFPPRRPGEVEEVKLPAVFGPEVTSILADLTGRSASAFKEVRFIIPVMQRAHRVRERYQKGDATITPTDVKQAKEDFDKHKDDYQKLSKIITQGMPTVHKAIANYPNALVVHQVYNRYLAQLLVSQEIKGAVESYVFKMADGEFDLTEPDFTLTEDEKLREITIQKKTEDFRELLQKDTNRLEARYRKRKLMLMLQKGTPKYKILGELVKVSETDPDDIKTHILAARLIAEHSQAMTNTAKRIHFREEALNHCKVAFARIDAYLDLQGIDDIRKRDMVRVGFVKTISAIRNPLIRRT